MGSDVNLGATVAALRGIADQLDAEADAPPGLVRIIWLKDAAYIAGVSEAQMRKRCDSQKYGVHAGGYGCKQGGRRAVVFAPFIASLPVSALERVNSQNCALARV